LLCQILSSLFYKREYDAILSLALYTASQYTPYQLVLISGIILSNLIF